MADISVSDVKVEYAGVTFTLRATVGALSTIEPIRGEPYYVVLPRIFNSAPRLTDLAEVFASIAVPHGKHTAAGLMALITFEDQAVRLKELYDGVSAACNAATPKKSATAEAGGTASVDPQ